MSASKCIIQAKSYIETSKLASERLRIFIRRIKIRPGLKSIPNGRKPRHLLCVTASCSKDNLHSTL